MRLVIGMTIILLLIVPTSGQAQIFPLGNLVDEEFSFRVSISADYTNHIDPSMLITVEGNEERSFAVTETGSNTSSGSWIAGIEQVSVLNSVEIGVLHNSGFNVSSNPTREASINPFNITAVNPLNYTDLVNVQPVVFNQNNQLNTTFQDNSSVITPFISIPISYFVIDVATYINSYNEYLSQLTSSMTVVLGLTPEISSDEESLTYEFSGTIIDFHRFTMHTSDQIENSEFNLIDVEGRIQISYDGNVLSEYFEGYDISIDGVRLMQFQTTINVRPGSVGNIIIGQTPLISEFGWPLLIIIGVVLIFATRYLTKRYG